MATVHLQVTTLTASEARPGDVVQAQDGSVFQCDGEGQWSQMELVLTESGLLWSPPGELVLLVRDGRPQVAAERGAS